MRGNSPIGDFNTVLNVVEDEPAVSKLTREDLELAKVSKSPDWKVILAYLNARISVCKEEMFKTSLDGGDLTKIGAGFLASRAVVNELQAVIDKVELTAKAVNDAAKSDAS
jgi:hypothetical protein